jgi:predicted metallopeptidase
MPAYEEAPDLKCVASQLVDAIDQIAHIEVDDVLFMRETETTPKFLAKCYRFNDHPICFFTDKAFAIVVYQSNVDHMTQEQMQLLLLHEMMHIPATGERLVDHDVKDFRAILEFGLDWHEPGAKVPDLLSQKNG